MEIAMQMSPPIRSVLVHQSQRAVDRAMNAVLRNLMDNAVLAANPMAVNPFDIMAHDEWGDFIDWRKEPEVRLADALEQAQRAPKLTVALANKLMRDAHKRGDARAFNAAREALRSL